MNTAGPAKQSTPIYIDDADRDVPIVAQAFCRIYSLGFMMTGNELIAEQLEQQTRDGVAQALEFLRFNEFPEQRLFDRIVDAQFVHQCEIFFSGNSDAPDFGTLTAVPDCLPAGPAPSVTTPQLQEKVLLLPATERLIYLLCYSLGYGYVDVGRLLRLSVETTRRAAVNACVMLRSLLNGKRLH